jgi:hypothetical protein
MDWISPCNRAIPPSTSLDTLLLKQQSGGGVIVAFYLCGFFLSSVFFWRWKVLNQDARAVVWRYYGLFTAMIAIGSLCGSVAWGSRMIQRILQ